MYKSKIIQIWTVVCDSGQLMICDPCNIDHEWKFEPFKDIRIYKNKITGDLLEFRKDFKNYEDIIEKYWKSMNDLEETWEREKLPLPKSEFNFSYNASSIATLSAGSWQLYFNNGDLWLATVLSTSWDWEFPVMAEVIEKNTSNWNIIKIIKRVWIELMSDEDIESYFSVYN